MGGMTQALRTRPSAGARCQGWRVLGLLCRGTPKDRPKLCNTEGDSGQSRGVQARPPRSPPSEPEHVALGAPVARHRSPVVPWELLGQEGPRPECLPTGGETWRLLCPICPQQAQGRLPGLGEHGVLRGRGRMGSKAAAWNKLGKGFSQGHFVREDSGQQGGASKRGGCWGCLSPCPRLDRPEVGHEGNKQPPPGPPRGFSWLPQADHAIAPVWREGVWPPLTALPGGGPLCWLFGGPQGLPPGASPGCSRGMETQAPASRTSGGAGIPMHTDPALVGTHSPGDGEDSNARGGPHAAAPGAWNKVTPTLWFLEPRDGPSLPLHTSRELGCLGPVGLPREGTPYGRLPGPTSGQALGSESGP